MAQKRSRSRSCDRGSRRRSRCERRLEDLYSELLHFEREISQQYLHVSNDEGLKEARRRLKTHIGNAVRQKLPEACGYSSGVEPTDIALDFNCCVLQARGRHGRDCYQQNADYSIDNHIDMVRDKVRVKAFESAIARVAKDRRVLDVGSGAFCLLGRMALNAGAASVHAVEMSREAAFHAVELCRREAAESTNCRHMISAALGDTSMETEAVMQRSMDCLRGTGARLLPHRMQLSVLRELSRSSEEGAHENQSTSSGGNSLCCVVTLWREEGEELSSLHLHQGVSTEVALPGPYDVLVHEILGHVASSEGVATTIADLVGRGLCSPSCAFVPAAAGTLFAPSTRLELSTLEKVLMCFYNGECGLHPLTKYHVRGFAPQNLSAPAQPFEWLEFDGPVEKLLGPQERRVVFVTERDGLFDGLHFHLHVKLDAETTIDTLASDTTWSTTYVRLLEDGLWLPSGSRIVCNCKTWQEGLKQCYSVSVEVGEPWDERHMAEFSWEGCS